MWSLSQSSAPLCSHDGGGQERAKKGRGNEGVRTRARHCCIAYTVEKAATFFIARDM